MAKILISPLGVGGRFQSTENHQREYLEACYQIGETSYPASRFMASVLYKHFQLDGIIFIGTVKSMWEEVYRFFCEKNGVPINEEYWLKLATQIDNLDCNSPLNSLNLSPIEEVLGVRSQCILIKYGLNQAELWENFDRIIQVVNSLEKGDQLYIDITHSFRSLSLFLFLTVTFINDLLAEKQIEIAGVFYGMVDVVKELKYAPVVDLKPLFEMTAWIKGAYILKNYGNGELIAELLKAQGDDELAAQIDRLSQAVNINYVNAIRQRSSDLKCSLQKSAPSSRPFGYLKNILENFVRKFARTSAQKESEFQLKLSGWYFDNQRYATGYITLAEAIITYLCEITNKDPRSQPEREAMKKFLRQSENCNSDLAQIYFKVNPIRNSIAHALLDVGAKTENFTDAIQNAKLYQKKVQEVFKTGMIK